MKRFSIPLIALFVLFCAAPLHAGPYYFYSWSSPKPVNPASIRIDIEGGTIVENYISDDHTWGTVNMDAPRECLFMTWHAQTESGIVMYDRVTWDTDCSRLFIPLLDAP